MRWLPSLLLLFITSPVLSQTGSAHIMGDGAGMIANAILPSHGKWIIESGLRSRTAHLGYTQPTGYYPLHSFFEFHSRFRYGLFQWLELNMAVAAGMQVGSYSWYHTIDPYVGPPEVGGKARIIQESGFGSISLAANVAIYALSEMRLELSTPRADLRLIYALPEKCAFALEANVGTVLGFRPEEPPLVQFGLRSGLQTPAAGWAFWMAYFGYADFKRASHWADFTIIKQVDDHLQLHINMALELHPGLYFQRQYRINRYGQGSFGATYSFK